MRKTLISSALFSLLLIFSPTSDALAQEGNPVLYKEQAVLYFRSAAEYRALCYQAFNAAKRTVDEAVRNHSPKSKRTKTFAVVVDIDETMLDNSPLEAENLYKGKSFDPKAFSEWVELGKAKAVPGAVEFTSYAAKKGVAVIYVSNRSESDKKATMGNLIAAGFPNVSERTVLLSPTGSGTKEPRRMSVAADFQIIALIGDDLNDMSDAFEKLSVDQRLATADRFREEFGRRFIVLPNPMYGSWENSVYEYKRLSNDEKISARKAAVTQNR